jgi:hypothetical protein
VSGGFQNVSNALCAVAGGTAQNGSNAVRYSGTITSTGHAVACFKAIAVTIPVDEKMTLSYSINPQSTLGRFAGVDLAMTDGTTLHAAGALDTAGVSMNPATGRGTVNQWTKVKCVIGRWLAGTTISRILVLFDHSGETGQFNGFIDNVTVQSDNAIVKTIGPVNKTATGGRTVPVSARYFGGMVRITNFTQEYSRPLTVKMYSGDGRLVVQKQLLDFSVPVLLKKGVYFIRLESGSKRSLNVKLVAD